MRPLRRRLRALRSGIVFTRVFEDHEVDRRALAIERDDNVLVIASAGDKALDAIAWGAGSVVAVDSNPAQLRLVALKVAAVRSLDHGQLIELFSVGRSPAARAIYAARLRPLLDKPARRYWDRWIGICETGLHVHHPLGLAMASAGFGLRLLGGPLLVPAILRSPDTAAQARAYERVFRHRFWNPVTRWLLGRTLVLRSVVLDPQERSALGHEGFAGWLEARVSHVVTTSLIRENPYLMPILAGLPADPRFEVPWLRAESLGRLADAAGRVWLENGSVVDVLAAAPAAAYHAVDLSNVPDWLVEADRQRLWDALGRAVRPGGRVLLRSVFAVPPAPRGPAAGLLVQDAPLSAELTDAERTGIYRAVVLLRRTDGESAAGPAAGRAAEPTADRADDEP
jgi:S-adenosylmethionine-diacylglycerol 3-amino-3-carboxypropyl transferase